MTRPGTTREPELRIVSLAPSCTELVYALGSQANLVGRSRYCDYPMEAAALPVVSGFIDMEADKIAQLRPDVVLTQSYLQRALVEQLINLDLNVVALNPVRLPDVYTSIRLLGNAIGRPQAANALVDQMRNRMDALATSARAPGAVRPTAYMEEWALMTAGHWLYDLLDAANCENVFAEVDPRLHGDRRRVTNDEAIHRDPEIVFICWPGKAGDRITPEWIRRRRGWKNVKAVRNNRIHVLNCRPYMRPGPRLVEGLQELVALAHPELRDPQVPPRELQLRSEARP